jgi:transcription antitermination protein NusB
VRPGKPDDRAGRGGARRGAPAGGAADDELQRPGTRSGARQRALEILYAADLLEQPIAAVLERELNDQHRPPPDAYTVELVTGVERRRAELDVRVEGAAERWTLERMPLVDRNLLRLGVFELLERREVPTAVILDEAIELAKLLSTEDSGRFVNGVLGRIARDIRGG